jgi:23S rRNA (cytidine1920-2'-O)/16S rRNA (cytidine1409-2'-O)-methyltransferase
VTPPGQRRRADALLVERGLAPSRAQAQALILAGRVFSGERRVEKAGALFGADTPLDVRGGRRFVSRGGDKLDGALAELELDVSGLVAVDVGASTGGFTDCLLQCGAARVYAVDVGRGQLAPELARDARVVVRDRTNARHLRRTNFPDAVDLAVVDASFIGLDKLLPALADVLPAGARLLAMVKPQFEVGRAEARRTRGVVRDANVRNAALERVRAAIAENGFTIAGECDSRLAGPKGNLERFMLAVRRR